MRARIGSRVPAVLAGLAGLALAATPAVARDPFVGPLNTVDVVASTVPANGDQNPYGVAVVKDSVGALHRGNVLVSNFNNNVPPTGQQGTGKTIVQVSPDGTVGLFAQIDPNNLPGPCPGGVGLTTALTILPGGWVVVGSTPTSDGMPDTLGAGCLLVLDSTGTVRETIAGHGINGPWDMTSVSFGDMSELFVTNVLNGTVAGNNNEVDKGTVLRISLRRDRSDKGDPPRLVDTTQIGSGFGEKTDPSALVIGPTGVGLGRGDTLYVADTLGNRITAIPNAVRRDSDAGTGRTVSSGGNLNGPLGLAIAPDGDILTVNSLDGNLVETTPRGNQVAVRVLDATGTPPGAGALFGLAVNLDRNAVYFVDNATNTLNVLH
ncbi:hypothetical protein [Kitasatospora sp. LaBMicrA B282]|uniref:hypothetical protein n=1 Tax=Kitasatospora sp. LaBMicrA B282 TaxID=3420949 RepID=UPI003D0FEB3D